MIEIFKYQRDNMNIAIASGLAEELTKQLGHEIQVFGPTVEASLTHAMVVAKFNEAALYSIKINDGKAIVKIIGGDMSVFHQQDNETSFDINQPSFVQDLVRYAGVTAGGVDAKLALPMASQN